MDIKNKNFQIGIILFALVCVGFFLRVYKIGNQSLWIDEGFTLMQTKAIHAHGYPRLLSGELELKDVLMPYILNTILPFTENISILRSVSAIFGTLSIWIIFLIGRQVWGVNVGIIAAFLMTFSYWNIAWSRQLRPYSLLIFFVLLFFLNVALFEKNKRNKFLFFALISIILATLSKTAGFLLIGPYILYLLLKRKYKTFSIVAVFLLSLFGIFYKNILLSLNLERVNYLGYYLVGYLYAYFGFVFILAIVTILALTIKKVSIRIFSITVGVFILLSLVFFSFFVLVSQQRYLLFIIPLIFLYASIGMVLVTRSRKYRIMVLIALSLIVDMFSLKSMQFIPRENYYLEEYTPQPDFSSAYSAIKKNIKNEDMIVSAYPYMDEIYLGRSDFALPISYTGRDKDSTRNQPLEHYSGVPIISQEKKINIDLLVKKLHKANSVYFLLDAMALARTDETIVSYIQNNGSIIFEKNENMSQRILVYRVDF